MAEVFRCGVVALVGRANVGKSTLFNRLVGTRLSIISKRPQTTREHILGIKTIPSTQWVYVDTPGIGSAVESQRYRYTQHGADPTIASADCAVLVITAQGWRRDDERALALVERQSKPVLLAINMIDRCRDRSELLPLISRSASKMNFAEIVPLSAKTGDNIPEIETALRKYFPEREPLYPVDQITDRTERFIAAEFIREQIFHRFGQEVPYSARVGIDRFQERKSMLFIEAVIEVERKGQKPILIGKGGARLKEIGQNARLAMEQFFGMKIELRLWVKVGEPRPVGRGVEHPYGLMPEH